MAREGNFDGSDERFGAEIGKIGSEGVKIKFEAKETGILSKTKIDIQKHYLTKTAIYDDRRLALDKQLKTNI